MTQTLISVDALEIGFHDACRRWRPVLRGIDLRLAPGEILGLVGESGSGKSTLATAMLGLLRAGSRVRAGTVHVESRSLPFTLQPGPLLGELGLGLVPQHAESAMTPHLTLGNQLEEILRVRGVRDAGERRAKAIAWLREVRLSAPEALLARYPHQLSGGQQQRASIALALALEPRVLIMDEPTTGLDASTQSQILELLAALRERLGTSIVFVSHDLGAVSHLCDRVAVMYAGRLVEVAPTAEFVRGPRHPYARALLAATPGSRQFGAEGALEGTPPLVGSEIQGCAFAPRCPHRRDACSTARPEWQGRHACHDPLTVPPKASATAPRPPAVGESSVGEPLLAVEALSLCYRRPGWRERLRGEEPAPIVRDVFLGLRQGETLALIGESGSGKTSILKALAGLLPPRSGRISLRQEPLAGRVEGRQPFQRQKIQYIFQHASTALNPRLTVFQSLAPVLSRWFGLTGETARRRAQALLEEVRLPALYLDRLPTQLSGGEQQRVAIARALAAEPDILLCDEITSALDVSVQAAIVRLLERLKRERGLSLIFVTHDLGLVTHFADRVLVLRDGLIEHQGSVASLGGETVPDYVRLLMQARLVAA